MRWLISSFVVVVAMTLACSSPPRRVQTAPLPPALSAAAAWPDVAREARVEKSAIFDAAVVVAVERHDTLPAVAGAHVSGEDWVRFFPTVLGMPSDRVTALFDTAATPSTITSAVRAAATRVGPGGRLWFVAVGHAIVDEASIVSAANRPQLQLVSVLDSAPKSASVPTLLTPAPTPSGTLAPIIFSLAHATPLPGAPRPALSYLLMGALRGWGDRDHDGRVTASEAAAYIDVTLRVLAPHGTTDPLVSVTTPLSCSQLTTLSVAREPAPNAMEIVPRVPPGPHADATRLASAVEAIREADAQLALARASQGLPELREPRFTGEGENRRVEVVPIPPEVEATVTVRLEQAKALGGQAVREAAPLLVEAARVLLAYGRFDDSRRILMPILDTRCGADAAGYRAWESLMFLANTTGTRQDVERLAARECAYDEASLGTRESLLRPIRFAEEHWMTRNLYERAEGEPDATVARCTWSAVAERYAASWWSDSERFSQVEAALNGAYAYRRLGRTDDAAALYRSYVQKQGGARAGENDSDASARRRYAFHACACYFAIASTEPPLFPGRAGTWTAPASLQRPAPARRPTRRCHSSIRAPPLKRTRSRLARWPTIARSSQVGK